MKATDSFNCDIKASYAASNNTVVPYVTIVVLKQKSLKDFPLFNVKFHLFVDRKNIRDYLTNINNKTQKVPFETTDIFEGCKLTNDPFLHRKVKIHCSSSKIGKSIFLLLLFFCF